MEFTKQIETLFRTGAAGGLTDAELIARFLERRGDDAEAAFAVLVDRHGPMVLRVCRQVLRDETDAEDAAQATFLVLARRAASIGRRESVGCWLHGVALRVAAKARVAASRRRAHELRGGAMRTALHCALGGIDGIENDEAAARLHEELGALPRSFREPLILCYLEGLTQEQAAAQLRCPLGTIQSRLARGRAKLKSRLEKRGAGLAAALNRPNPFGFQSGAAPPAWAETTVRLAMQFANRNGPAVGGAASVVLAEEVARALVLSKVRLAAAMILGSAVLVFGAGAWAVHVQKRPALFVATNTAQPPSQADPEAAQAKAPPPEQVTRSIRGIVRDEQGRPVPKAWIGDGVWRTPDQWQVIMPLDRVRERKEPFRDEQGKIVLAGALGKYFEVRDQEGKWQPIRPGDIRRYEPSEGSSPWPRALPLAYDAKAARDQGRDVFETRAAKGQLMMRAFLSNASGATNRTDASGQFACEFTMFPEYGAHVVHAATPDFSREGIAVVRYDDPDEPVDIVLEPVRRVRARVIETPKDHPEQGLQWNIYALSAAAGALEQIAAIGGIGAHWRTSSWAEEAEGSSDQVRRFEASLPQGRYKICFDSDTLHRVVEVKVPAGPGPLDLPEIHLDSAAWVQMIGKPAAEIDAVDRDGTPMRLADFRGRAVVLCFWSSRGESDLPTLPHLALIQKRFSGKPLTILLLHDSSITSLANFKDAVAPLLPQFTAEPPVYFLLDRPPPQTGPDPHARPGAEEGSGRTNRTYQTFGRGITFVINREGAVGSATEETLDRASTFSIGKTGELVYDFGEISPDNLKFERGFEFSLVARALEDVLGLPRSPLPKSKPDRFLQALSAKKLSEFKGKLIDLEGRPIAGAKLATYLEGKGNAIFTTDPAGEFVFRISQPATVFSFAVEALGFASRHFKFAVTADGDEDVPSHGFISVDSGGRISEPLRLGPGVDVMGRVTKNGMPVAGVLIGMKHVDRDSDPYPVAPPEAKTDANGIFRLPHILAQTEFWVYGRHGSIAGGGALAPRRLTTGREGSTADLGVFHLEEGRTLAGRVVCSDGKPIPSGAVIYASCPRASGGPHLKLEADGRFEFKGLPAGGVSVMVGLPGNEGEKKYHVSAKNKCRLPLDQAAALEGQLDHDITDLTILLDPGRGPNAAIGYDPAAWADFNDAKAGPITGVPPTS
jgi:RNA polymerase sigma-70 factor (ECF subfamily)